MNEVETRPTDAGPGRDLAADGDAWNPVGAWSKDLSNMVQRAKDFYARHPTLVKALGTVAAAALARRLFPGQPRRSRFRARRRFF